MSDYPYAVYTMSLLEAIDKDNSLLDSIVLDTDEHTSKLKSMIISRFWNYEIGGETIGEMKLYLSNRLNTCKDYYLELINAYETKINMLDGAVSSSTISETGTNNGTGSSKDNSSTSGTSNADTNNIHYDLPRSSTTEQHPSSKDSNTNNNTNSNTTISNTSNETSSTYETKRELKITGGINVITLKDQYMKIIKNIWYQFADEFKTCFVELFN